MKKPVSLTHHTNTLHKRKKREKFNDLMHDIKRAKEPDIRAYALVTFDSSGGTRAYWDTGSIMPMWGFSATVGRALERDMEESGVEETWKPKADQY